MNSPVSLAYPDGDTGPHRPAPLSHGLWDLIDGAAAVATAACPTTSVGLDQLWRTARRRARRAFSAAPVARRLDLGAIDASTVRRSSVAALIGSGPSAPLVHDERWAPRIAGMDVFAVNHAAAIAPHPLVCSIEVPDLKDRQSGLSTDQGVRFLEWAIRRARAAAPSTHVVIRATDFCRPTMQLVERIEALGAVTHLALQAGLPVRGRRGSERFARWSASRSALRWPGPSGPFVCVRGGLGFLVSLCVAMGYDEIVIFGVDLYSNAYYFDDRENLDGFDEIHEFVTAMGPPAPVPHATAIRAGARPAVVDALAMLDRYVLRPTGRRLTVASSQSLLHPALALADPSRR